MGEVDLDKQQVTVEELIELVRERSRLRRQSLQGGRAGGGSDSHSQDQITASLSQYNLDDLRAAVATNDELWKQLGTLNPRPPGAHHSLVQFIKNLIRRSLTWYTRPLAEYSKSVAHSLTETEHALANTQSNIAELASRLVQCEEMILGRLETIRIQLDQLSASHETLGGRPNEQAVATDGQASKIESKLQKTNGPGRATINPKENGTS